VDTVVARIGKPHGLRGEVTVQLHTDNPQGRLVPGARFGCEGLSGPPGAIAPTELTIETVRVHNGVWLLAFEGYADRTAAEALRGGRLVLAAQDRGADGGPDDGGAGADGGEDEDGWYESELLGLAVYDVAGERVGEVTGLDVGIGQDRLAVRLTDGRSGLVPLVEALVPVLDPAAGRVVIDAPDGLFDLET
jgi:16S rRNA processing protein RimM